MLKVTFRTWSRFEDVVIRTITKRLVQPHYGIPYFVKPISNGSREWAIIVESITVWHMLAADLRAYGYVFDVKSEDC